MRLDNVQMVDPQAVDRLLQQNGKTFRVDWNQRRYPGGPPRIRPVWRGPANGTHLSIEDMMRTTYGADWREGGD